MPRCFDSPTPATVLFSGNALLPPRSRLLLIGVEVAVAMALHERYHPAEIVLTHFSHGAIQNAAFAFAQNDAVHARCLASIALPPDDKERYDTVCIHLPKGRKLAQRWLVSAFQALAPGGKLYLTGERQQGVQTVMEDARQLFGSAATLAYKKGWRIAQCLKDDPPPPPAWAAEPGVQPGTWLEFSADLAGREYRLRSLPGVFSADRLDSGSALLLSALSIPPAARVLDIGCGWGALGLAAAAVAGHVDLIDDNLLAVACAEENIRLAGLTNARAWAADGASSLPAGAYDLILTNPPFHGGREVNFLTAEEFILHAHRCLARQGRFWLVANRFIRYNDVIKKFFSNVQVAAQTGKFHVLTAVR